MKVIMKHTQMMALLQSKLYAIIVVWHAHDVAAEASELPTLQWAWCDSRSPFRQLDST